MMRIMTVVGARPQFVKAAVVSKALADEPQVSEDIIHTGQHYDAGLSDVFFEELGIPQPARCLEVGSGRHGQQTGRMMERLEPIVEELKPDWMLLYGDTNSTLAGALVAAKLHVRIAHVEAGLRSFNRAMPEEINRICTDHVSDLLFAPTATAVRHLQREGFEEQRIVLSGDVMYDASLLFGDLAKRSSRITERLGLAHGQYVLATLHRAENTDDPVRLGCILSGLTRLTRQQVQVVLPLHPRTARALDRHGLRKAAEALTLIDPVGYLDMLQLERKARLIATDSGGVQKEAYFLRVPCVTLRDETEWTELVELGWNRLLPPTDEATVGRALEQAVASVAPDDADAQPYGNGDAAATVVRALMERS